MATKYFCDKCNRTLEKYTDLKNYSVLGIDSKKDLFTQQKDFCLDCLQDFAKFQKEWLDICE